MKVPILISLLFIIFSLSYSFKSYSQDSSIPIVKNENLVIKNCNDTKIALENRRNMLKKSLDFRMQKISDINSSIQNLDSVKKMDKKFTTDLEKFYVENDILLLEREDLISKLDILINFDCEKDKKGLVTKLKIFNSNYKNHLRKELNIQEDFEKNIFLKLDKEQK